MKLTFLMPCYPWIPMGGFRVVYEYANQLALAGHEVTVVHPQTVKFGPQEKVSIFEKFKNLTKARLINNATPVINWQRIDPRVNLIYAPDTAPDHVPDGDAIFATAWNTVASVLDYDDSKGEKFYLIQGYETFRGPKTFVDETWRAPIHKVVIAKWLLALGKQLGAGPMTYIPNAVDHNHYKLVTPLQARPKQVAMLFSHSKIKGSKDGIEALEVAKQKYPDLSAVFFGTGRDAEWIPKWVQYYRNPPQDFIVREIYNKSTIFLNASWTEGFALPPAEAACCGCAVVATDSGGVRDFIDDGETGLLSPPKEPQTLAKNLCRVLDDDHLRIKLAEAGHRRLSEFTWEKSGKMLESFILSSLITEGSYGRV